MNFINKNFKWISLGAVVLAFISLFLPFASVSADVFGMAINKSVSFIEGDGVIVLFTLLAGAGLIFLKNGKFSLIPLGIGFAITIYDAINVGNAMGEVSGLSSMVKTSLGIGFYLLLLGFIVSIAGLVYGNFIMKKATMPATNNTMNQQQPVNNMVNQMPVQNQEPMAQMNMQPSQPVNEPVAKFCSNCGTKQNADSKFCESCGSPLN